MRGSHARTGLGQSVRRLLVTGAAVGVMLTASVGSAALLAPPASAAGADSFVGTGHGLEIWVGAAPNNNTSTQLDANNATLDLPGGVTCPPSGATPACAATAPVAANPTATPPTPAEPAGYKASAETVPLQDLIPAASHLAVNGAVNASTVELGSGASETVSSYASAANLDLSDLGLSGLDVTAVASSCEADAFNAADEGTTLSLAGESLPSVIPTDDVLPIPAGDVGILGLEANVSNVVQINGEEAVEVIGLEVQLLDLVTVYAAVSYCNVNGPDVGQVPTINALTATPPGISPDTGPVTGGTAITITGTDFAPDSSVTFGGVSATNVVVVSPSEITCVDPAGNGTVPVVVTDTLSSAQTYALAQKSAAVPFTYEVSPQIASLSPPAGPAAGGNTVTIVGANAGAFTSTPAPVVYFGANAVPPADVTVTNTATTSNITVSAVPAGTAGTVVGVYVTDEGITSNTVNYGYENTSQPEIVSMTPTAGPTAGGTTVTITGGNLNSGTITSVDFGTVAGTNVTLAANDNSLTVTTPAEVAGQVVVTITTSLGGESTATANAENQFTFVGSPSISEFSPTSGPVAGGNTVTITGLSLCNPTAVDFGTVAATSFESTPDCDTVNVVAPAGPANSTASISVVTAGGTAKSVQEYTWTNAASVTSISPTFGPAAGGTVVTITGTAFQTGATVAFGSTKAASVTYVSPTELMATTAPESAGIVYVTVTQGTGAAMATSAINTANSNQQFTFYGAPTISQFSPTAGTTAGGNIVEIDGTNLCSVSAVDFGSTPSASFGVNSACNTIVAQAPPGTGFVNITITTPGGSATGPVQYEYSNGGYWEVGSDGGIFAFGSAPYEGSEGATHLNSPIVAMAATPDHQGYWLFAGDGGVFAFGDANFYGSLPSLGITPNKPMVAAESTSDGLGYRMFAADGGVFNFGDADYEGSLPGLNVVPEKPITAAISTPLGQGYWLTAADGGVFSFGNATFYGSIPSKSESLTAPVVAMSATPYDGGYWLFTKDGNVYTFGDAPYEGRLENVGDTVAYVASTSDGGGYWFFTTGGHVYGAGDADDSFGSVKGSLTAPIVGGAGFGEKASSSSSSS